MAEAEATSPDQNTSEEAVVKEEDDDNDRSFSPVQIPNTMMLQALGEAALFKKHRESSSNQDDLLLESGSPIGGISSPTISVDGETSIVNGRATTVSIISGIGPSESILKESHSAVFEKPSGPRRKHAPSRQMFSEMKEDQEPAQVDPSLVDQVAFVNPILEEDTESGTSISKEAALAKQALEQMKLLKHTEIQSRPTSPSLSGGEFLKVQLKKTEIQQKNSISSPGKNEALEALSRLRKVESSPAKQDLAATLARKSDLQLGQLTSSTSTNLATPTEQNLDAQDDNAADVAGDVTSISEKEEKVELSMNEDDAKKAEGSSNKVFGCCVIC